MKTNMSRGELRKLRRREFDLKSVYDSVLIVPSPAITRGYRSMLVVGIRDGSPVEIAAECDDLVWNGSSPNGDILNAMRFDMDPANDSVHVWANNCVFEVGISSESTDVTLKYRRA